MTGHRNGKDRGTSRDGRRGGGLGLDALRSVSRAIPFSFDDMSTAGEDLSRVGPGRRSNTIEPGRAAGTWQGSKQPPCWTVLMVTTTGHAAGRPCVHDHDHGGKTKADGYFFLTWPTSCDVDKAGSMVMEGGSARQGSYLPTFYHGGQTATASGTSRHVGHLLQRP